MTATDVSRFNFFLLKGFVLAIVAQEISSRPANATHTYGLVRAEVSIIIDTFQL